MWYRCSNGPRQHDASLYASDGPGTNLHRPLLASSTSNTSSSSSSSEARECRTQAVLSVSVSTPRPQATQALKRGLESTNATAGSQPRAIGASSAADQGPANSTALKQACLNPAGPELPLPPGHVAGLVAATAATESAATPKLEQQQQQPRSESAPLQASASLNCESASSPRRGSSPPAAQGGLQQASSSSSSSSSNTAAGASTAGMPASPCCDPLLHWSEIWSGPGIPGVLRRHHTNSSSSSSAHSNGGSGPVAAAAAPGGSGALRLESPQCSSPSGSPRRPSHVWWAGLEQSQPLDSPPAAAVVAAAGHGAAPAASAASSVSAAAAAAGGAAAAQGAGASKCKDTRKSHNRCSSSDVRRQQQMQMLLSTPNEAVHLLQQQQQQHVQLAQLLLPRSNSASSLGPAIHPQRRQQQQQQQGSSFRWWLLGGAALAVISGSAVFASYVAISYTMKAAMAYSFAWKAATGVAAAEGLTIGGWGCSSVRKQKAAAATLARLQRQAARELAALRGLLQQREAQHGQELSSLSMLNERLNRLTQSLRAENSTLQGSLERAAAERKSLEAAAALEAAHAQSGALVEVAAAHSERVAGEVAELSKGQQQLVALVCELREDLLGLVTDADEANVLVTSAGSGVSAELVDDGAAGGSSSVPLGWLYGAVVPNATHAAEVGHLCRGSAAAATPVEAGGSAAQGNLLEIPSSRSDRGSSHGLLCKPSGLRLKSVRGSVDAALAASIGGALQL